MKKINVFRAITLFTISFLVTSCDAIAGIFKAGMGFGIFLVVLVVILIIYFISRMTKK